MMRCIRYLAPLLCLAVVLTGPLSTPLAASDFRAGDASGWSWAEAAHLLRRAGFGGTPEQIEKLAGLGRDAAVDYLVDFENVPIGDKPYPMRTNDTRPLEQRLLADLTPEKRSEVNQRLRRLNDQHMAAVRDWWVRRMIVSNRPLQEKMTLFWHGHFTSGYREVRSWRDMYRQNEFFRDNALADFETLLQGISRDPAMVKYLDNARNVKTSPNENYARELMELFSLGEGSYDEKDIKEAARAFTGWGVNLEGFRFYPLRHDFGKKTFFGKRGRFDGDDIVAILMRHPNTSRFMARNLLEFFVYREPSSEAVEGLARIIRDHDFGFREVMRTLLKSDEFYSDRVMFAQIKSPVDLVIGAVRSIDMDTVNPRGLYNACRQMGQNLFQPPNVKGWDGDARWITTSTLFSRYNFGKKLVGNARSTGATTLAGRIAAAGGDGDAAGKMMMMDDDVAMRPTLAQIGGSVVATAAYDPAPVLAEYGLTSPDEIVAHYTRRLLQRELSPERTAILVEALSPGQKPFRLDAPGAAQRIRDVISLIMSTPEFQLY